MEEEESGNRNTTCCQHAFCSQIKACTHTHAQLSLLERTLILSLKINADRNAEGEPHTHNQEKDDSLHVCAL